jgi:Cu/Ag efflux protein CusF
MIFAASGNERIMRNKILMIVLTLAPALSSCQPNTPPNATNQTIKPNSTIAAATPSTEVKNYDGAGTVTKINLEIGSVELDHEEIKGIMPKMIMEFYVSDKAQLKDLKVGDRVDFVLEDKGGAERIVNIKKSGKR